MSMLRYSKRELREEIAYWRIQHSDAMTRIAILETELATLKQKIRDQENADA